MLSKNPSVIIRWGHCSNHPAMAWLSAKQPKLSHDSDIGVYMTVYIGVSSALAVINSRPLAQC